MALRAGEQRDRTIVSNKGAQRHAVTVDHDFTPLKRILDSSSKRTPSASTHLTHEK
jgi:hypothetical protein